MTAVLEVPATLDAAAFDLLVERASAGGERLLFDARRVRFADPYGMIGLLAIAEHLGREGHPAPVLQLPDSPDVTGYLARMGFVSAAEKVFDVHNLPRGRRPDGASVLLPITVVDSHHAVHEVVERVGAEKIQTILTDQLHFGRGDAVKFSMLLSEVAQNITEHADSPGWIAVQTYDWSRRPVGRRVAVIAVMDLGIGFRRSLERDQAPRFGDRWGDATALEQAFIHAVTRFRDPGRGQGLKNIRKNVGVWGGKVSIRSGTARISDVPEWDGGKPMETGLPDFPGAQIQIVLPARMPAAASAAPDPQATLRARPG